VKYLALTLLLALAFVDETQSVYSTGSVAAPTVSWPAGVPTNTAPAFTGSEFDNRQAGIRLIPCKKD
jgi:hypothetical protein